MDYQLENLGDEGFQYIAQALVAKEYPNVQCFPVAQPDGGRDILSIGLPSARGAEAEIVVFQVKFSRTPTAKDERKELEKLLKEEAPKIKTLLAKGYNVKQFVLVTNIPGTAHLDTGSIDRVNTLLTKYLPCPAFVWWRNDMNRRLDDAWNIKWSYPQIMSGQDVMRDLIENGLGEHKERRISAIKSFLSDQYIAEEKVKFKQVHLQNKLLDLFIDVPIKSDTADNWMYHAGIFGQGMRARPTAYRVTMGLFEEDPSENEIGAAAFMLSGVSNMLASTMSMVLEGAPGQGKSTITQYVAQVYRMRLLQKDHELAKIEQAHLKGKMRLPIKVDLRDFAMWLSRKHPFDATNELPVPEKWQKNLESFLVFLISYYSKNPDFNATDFQAIIRTSSIILLFDGLDEVAEISQRKDVVDEIVRGTKRLRELAASLQTVVTSRPAAFANSPGMPKDSFSYFRLGSLTKPLITSYAEKWMKCQHLNDKEKSEIRTILKHKLDEPHIKELARNPMQLSILLGLIRSRGASLPDKRTSLYEQYVDLFFSRESEKSPIIRDHRELVIELHRYVAWYLHSDAQLQKGNGSISTENLRKLLVDYLRRECQDEALADQLLSGMVERVVALVSRVEGTYEFEVQPLREFFAAKYLFESAAPSPTGDEQPGSRPDIFDAIAKDFHWLNVTRFFAGCYTKGELPSLIDRLQELISLKEYKFLNHPRLLTSMLLNDWVFTQNVRSMRDAITLIVQGTGLRYFISSQKGDVTLQLPNKNGRQELVEQCFAILSTYPPLDYLNDLVRVIIANASGQEILTVWNLAIDSKTGEKLTDWLRIGLYLGILAKLPVANLITYLGDNTQVEARILLLAKARRWDALESSESIYERTVHNVLTSGDNFGLIRMRKNPSSLERFTSLMSPARYVNVHSRSTSEKLEEAWSRSNISRSKTENEVPTPPTYAIATKCDKISDLAEELAKLPVSEWLHTLDPLDELTQAIQKEFGNVWMTNRFAIASAELSLSKTPTKENEFFDSSKSVCQRVRYATERRSGVAWWNKQLDAVKFQGDTMLFLVVLFTWATPAVVKSVLPNLAPLLDSLPTEEWYKLFDVIRANKWNGPGKRNNTKSHELIDALPEDASERVVLCIGARLSLEAERKLYQDRLLNYSGHDQKILAVCQWFAGHSLFSKASAPSPYLSLIKRGYRQGVEQSEYWSNQFMRHSAPTLDLQVAKTIAAHPEEYPSFLLKAAEQVCQADTISKVIPVGIVAKNEKWAFA